jgi:hypothetical protein
MSKLVVSCTWDEVPHLTKKQKKDLWGSIPPYQREARSKGVPTLGIGAIYPVPEDDIITDDFAIPSHFDRAYGMDVGWKRTAGIWAARDREAGIIYLTSEHYRGQAEPSVHAEGFKARGLWIPGVIDPAARGRSQIDGQRLLDIYRELGLNLETADNSREAGIQKVWELLSSGRLKVFRSLKNWLAEYRIYRRDENGQIVKDDDHLMDATRYLIMSGLERMKVKPVEKEARAGSRHGAGRGRGGWMK